jgi:hypothetical protein
MIMKLKAEARAQGGCGANEQKIPLIALWLSKWQQFNQ